MHHEVDLRPVEGRLARLGLAARQVHAAGHPLNSSLGLIPPRGRADVFITLGIAEPESHAEVFEGEALEHFEREVDAALHLPLHLLVGAEDVGVVLGKAADPRHAAEFTRLLVAVDRAKLGQPERQLLVAPRPGLVDHRVVRAVHRFQQILLVFAHHDRLELAVGVVGIVAGDLVEIDLADVRRVDRLVAPRGQFVADEALEHAAEHGSLRHPEHEARADQGARREQVELLAEHPMIAAACFFQIGQMRVEIRLREPGGAVEPLELGIVGVALPVGAGDVRELEAADAAGARHVRAAAEVDEFSLTVER